MPYLKAKSSPSLAALSKSVAKSGAQTLRDDELIAVLFDLLPKPDGFAEDLATRAKILVKDFGLRGLITAFDSPKDFTRKTGLLGAKALLIQLVGEVVRRLTERDGAEISSSQDAYEYFREMSEPLQEQVCVACLSPENLAFHSQIVARGSSLSAECPMPNVFHSAFRFFCQRIVIAHNHPRGLAVPSERDLAWQKDLLETAKKLDVEIVDHLIIGKNGYYSFADHDLCKVPDT